MQQRVSYGFGVFLSLVSMIGLGSMDVSHAETLSGEVPGQFRVSEGGAAVYSVPIVSPKGVGDLSPELSFVYSSDSGNGDMGLGWGLSGMSGISRCGQSQDPDGKRHSVDWSSEDRFCLDGQRLFAVSGVYGADGTEYRTEIDGYTKIVSYGVAGSGPSWFKVWSKGGMIYEYGHTADSAIEGLNTDGSPRSDIRSWLLNKSSDRLSNILEYRYIEETTKGSYRLDKIEYGGNETASSAHTSSIQLSYEDRTDIRSGYYVGGKIESDKRLAHVGTYDGSTLVYQYNLSYDYNGSAGQSRLQSIEQCTAGGDCLSPVTFTWSAGITDVASIFNDKQSVDSYPGLSKEKWAADKHALYVLDYNGDGISDILLQARDEKEQSYLITGQRGEADPVATTAVTLKYKMDTDRWRSDKREVHILDYNGDGRQDVLLQGLTDSQNSYLLEGADDGFKDAKILSIANITKDETELHILDHNGDGRSDILMQGVGAKDTYLLTAGDTASGFETPVNLVGQYGITQNHFRNDYRELHVLDHNGDGLDDVLLQGITGSDDETYLLISSYSAFEEIALISDKWGMQRNDWKSNKRVLHVLDQNGDGLDDILLQSKGNWDSYLLIGTGSGYRDAENLTNKWGMSQSKWIESYNGESRRKIHIFDLNRDGVDDILLKGQTNNYNSFLLLSQNDDYADGLNVTSSSTWNMSIVDWRGTKRALHILDHTGNGSVDILLQGVSSSDESYKLEAQYDHVDLIEKITSSRGAAIDIVYGFMTDKDVYSRGEDRVYPGLSYGGAMTLVKEIRRDSGIKDDQGVEIQRRWSYEYEDAALDLERGSYQGFAKVTVHDQDRGTQKVSHYLQDFPYTGRLSKEELKLAKDASGAYFTYGEGVYEKRYTKAIETLENSWESVATKESTELAGTFAQAVRLKDSSKWRYEVNAATAPEVIYSPDNPDPNVLPEYSLLITAHETNYDVKAKLAAQEPDWDQVSPVKVLVNVAADIILGSSDLTSYALDYSNMPVGSEAVLINNGIIVGRYGAPNGGDGGHAVKTSIPLTITNNGQIYSGGGAGNKGGSRTNYRTYNLWQGHPSEGGCVGGQQTYYCTASGGTGGRGAGWYTNGAYYSSGAGGAGGSSCSPGPSGGQKTCGTVNQSIGNGGTGVTGGGLGNAASLGGQAGIVFNGFNLVTFEVAGQWGGRTTDVDVPVVIDVVSAPDPVTTLPIYTITLPHSSDVTVVEKLQAQGWNGNEAVHVTVEVEENAIIGSSSTSEYAIDFTGLLEGSEARLVNNGFIIGYAGASNGGAGGHAIKTNLGLEVYNGGLIYAGAGGGNKGSSRQVVGVSRTSWQGGPNGGCVGNTQVLSCTASGGNGGRGAGWYSQGAYYGTGRNGSSGSSCTVYGSGQCGEGVLASGSGYTGVKGANFGIADSTVGTSGYAFDGYDHITFKIEGDWKGRVTNATTTPDEVPASASWGSISIDANNSYLSRHFSSGGNKLSWVMESWVKRDTLGTNDAIFTSRNGGAGTGYAWIGFGKSNKITYASYATTYPNPTGYYISESSQSFNSTEWMHVAVAYDAARSDGKYVRIFVNGQEIAFGRDTFPAGWSDATIGHSWEHRIGHLQGDLTNDFDGRIGMVVYRDGTQIQDANDLLTGENVNGQWVVKSPISSVDYGLNGFALDFKNPSNIGADISGNNNHWTVHGSVSHEHSLTMPDDVPTVPEPAVDVELLINSHVAGDQNYPRSAVLQDDSYVTVWHSDGQDGSGHGVYMQRFTSGGAAVGSEGLVNSYTSGNQDYASVTSLSNGNYVVAWQSAGRADGQDGIYGKIYDVSGNVVTDEFAINFVNKANSQLEIFLTALAGGDFVATWADQNADNSYYGVYAQRFSSTGQPLHPSGDILDAQNNPVSSHLRVNDHTYHYQFPGEGIKTSDDGYVVSWHSRHADSNTYDIYTKKYDASGVVVSGASIPHTYTAYTQTMLNFAALKDGAYVAVWRSQNQDGSGYGTYGQRFNADGSKLGSEFQVNTVTGGHQQGADVAGFADGSFIVVWYSEENDGEIKAKYYDANGAPGDEFQVNDTIAGAQNGPNVIALSNGRAIVSWHSPNGAGDYDIKQKIFTLGQ